jgi:hypothetical protein
MPRSGWPSSLKSARVRAKPGTMAGEQMAARRVSRGVKDA